MRFAKGVAEILPSAAISSTNFKTSRALTSPISPLGLIAFKDTPLSFASAFASGDAGTYPVLKTGAAFATTGAATGASATGAGTAAGTAPPAGCSTFSPSAPTNAMTVTTGTTSPSS